MRDVAAAPPPLSLIVVIMASHVYEPAASVDVIAYAPVALTILSNIAIRPCALLDSSRFVKLDPAVWLPPLFVCDTVAKRSSSAAVVVDVEPELPAVLVPVALFIWSSVPPLPEFGVYSIAIIVSDVADDDVDIVMTAEPPVVTGASQWLMRCSSVMIAL